MYEGGPVPQIEKQQVVDAFKEKGKEDTEALELLKTWYQQGLDKIEVIPSKEECGKASIEFDIEYANLLQEAGLLQEAWEVLNDSLDKANNFREEEFLQQMKDIMKNLESSLP